MISRPCSSSLVAAIRQRKPRPTLSDVERGQDASTKHDLGRWHASVIVLLAFWNVDVLPNRRSHRPLSHWDNNSFFSSASVWPSLCQWRFVGAIRVDQSRCGWRSGLRSRVTHHYTHVYVVRPVGRVDLLTTYQMSLLYTRYVLAVDHCEVGWHRVAVG